MAYRTVNPYTNEVEHEYQNSSAEEVEAALANGHQLYLRWRNGEGLAERKQVITRLGELLRKNKTQCAEVMTRDMGKLIGEAEGEVELCASFCDYYVQKADEFLAPRPLYTASGSAYLLRQASGVLMAVEPWNFPFYQIARVFIPNFLVGNPMILKDASNCPTSAKKFADLVAEAGAPAGSLTNLFISYDQVGEIIADQRVQGVCLTGSERGGQAVAKEAAANLKKNTMELGGNDAFLVLPDADIDKLTRIIGQARLYNAGQVCTSSKRFILPDNLYDQFLQRARQVFSNVKMGNPLDRDTTLAPMNSKRAKDKLQKQVDTAVEHGAKVYYGNQPVEMAGQFFMPTILTNITPDNPLFDQEMFGPVMAVYKYSRLEDGIKLANNSSYGLGSTVFGEDVSQARKVAAQIEAGMTWINSGWASLPELPFGGVKHSGYGRELADLGFGEFINEHLVYQPLNK